MMSLCFSLNLSSFTKSNGFLQKKQMSFVLSSLGRKPLSFFDVRISACAWSTCSLVNLARHSYVSGVGVSAAPWYVLLELLVPHCEPTLSAAGAIVQPAAFTNLPNRAMAADSPNNISSDNADPDCIIARLKCG